MGDAGMKSLRIEISPKVYAWQGGDKGNEIARWYRHWKTRDLLRLDYEDALTMAEDDINENWEIYREKFFKGDFPRG